MNGNNEPVFIIPPCAKSASVVYTLHDTVCPTDNHEEQTPMKNTLQAVDSLCANEFAFEIAGQRVPGIFRISGLIAYKVDSAGHRIKPPFEVAKMVQRDASTPFNQWLRETLSVRDITERPRRDIAVVAVDDGTETRRWTVKGAWIQEVRYSDFNSASFEMVEETFVIMYDDIEESWPASAT